MNTLTNILNSRAMDHQSILIAPGPYKECLSSFDVAAAMKAGVEEILPNSSATIRPLSDGGSGIAKVLTEATGGRLKKVFVTGPTGKRIESFYGLLGDSKTAVVESATAAGLTLVPKDERNPLFTSTYGVGELILAAIEQGVENIIVGCGDSGTNDCGIGCAAALGVKFFCEGSSTPLDVPRGLDLGEIVKIDGEDATKRLSGVNITVACNLSSVLCGPEGTSIIYAPQKGASAKDVGALHKGVEQFASVVYANSGVDLSFIPGAGGAGGLAASLYAFFGARLLYSIDVIDQYLHLDEYFSKAQLVLTGEGCIDDRTATGKVCCGVALKAKKYGLPVVAIVGSIAQDHEDIFYNGIDAVESIAEGPISLEDSMTNAFDLIKRATVRVVRFMFKIPTRRG